MLFTLDSSYKWRLNEAEADPAYDNQVQNTDHIVPASFGHLAAAGNLQPLCAQCNQTRKSDKTNEEYLQSLVKDGVISQKAADARQKKTLKLLEEVYYAEYPEAKAFKASKRSEGVAHLENQMAVLAAYKKWMVAGKLTQKLASEYESLFKDTEVWQTLSSIEAIRKATGYANASANDVYRRKQHLQAAWEKVIGEKSVSEITIEEWGALNQQYLSQYSRRGGKYTLAGEFTKAKRALRAFAIISERDDLEEFTKALPGYARF